MKKLIFSLGIFAISVLNNKANSQIVVKETTKDSVVWYNKLAGLPKLVCFYSTEYSDYTLYFQNAKYTQIRDVKYLSIGNLETTKEFFNLLLGIANGGEKLTIELDKETWIISKSMGSVSVWSSYKSFYLTKKQIETIIETLN